MYKNIVEIVTVQTVNSYQYLGLVFTSNGNFNQAVNVLHDKGGKATYSLFLKKILIVMLKLVSDCLM